MVGLLPVSLTDWMIKSWLLKWLTYRLRNAAGGSKSEWVFAVVCVCVCAHLGLCVRVRA